MVLAKMQQTETILDQDHYISYEIRHKCNAPWTVVAKFKCFAKLKALVRESDDVLMKKERKIFSLGTSSAHLA
jgi:hypothetical protein